MRLSSVDCREIRTALAGKATGFRYADVAIWLSKADFAPPRKPDGTHRTWRHTGGKRVPLVDTGHGELLPVYVKKAARAVLAVGGCQDDT